MSAETVFLSVDNVLSIHQRLIVEFGGSAGTRDNGLLEAAVAMPKQRFGGALLHGDLAEKAAAQCHQPGLNVESYPYSIPDVLC